MKEILITDIIKFLNDRNFIVDYSGDLSIKIQKHSDIFNVQDNSIMWVRSKEFLTDDTLACIKSHNVVVVCPWQIDVAKNCLITNNPKEIFFSILREFFLDKTPPYISSRAVVETEKIGKNVSIGAGCYINKDVFIGDDVIIHANVVIDCPCSIGKGTEIFAGVIIGTEGFGYYHHKGVPERVPHFGKVIIGNYVDIGANTCIDRGCLGDTIIGDHVKINNLCHIAHNVKIEKNTMIAGGSTISGSTKIGENVYIAPASVLLDHLSIQDNAYIGMGSVVLQDVKAGKKVFGNSARYLDI